MLIVNTSPTWIRFPSSRDCTPPSKLPVCLRESGIYKRVLEELTATARRITWLHLHLRHIRHAATWLCGAGRAGRKRRRRGAFWGSGPSDVQAIRARWETSSTVVDSAEEREAIRFTTVGFVPRGTNPTKGEEAVMRTQNGGRPPPSPVGKSLREGECRRPVRRPPHRAFLHVCQISRVHVRRS